MTQRIFDIENEKDMADLWDILPDKIKHIAKENQFTYDGKLKLIAINWHDKTPIVINVDNGFVERVVCIEARELNK